jgi:hypothetical protein
MTSLRAKRLSLRLAAFVAAMVGALYIATRLVSGMEPPDWAQQAIEAVISPDVKERYGAAQTLIDRWPASVPKLITRLGSYDRADTKPAFSRDDVAALIALTDVVRSIVVNKDGAVEAFRRSADKDKAVKVLASAAAADNADLRLNATYILASVLDNSTVCVVLQNLHDPNISEQGIANLTQALSSVAGYAYQENANAIQRIVGDLKRSKTAQSSVQFLQDLDRRTQGAREPAPAEVGSCNIQ